MTNSVKEIVESLNLGCSVNLGAREALRLHGHIAKIEQQLAAFTTLSQEANKVIDHIALAVGCEKDRMACWESVDALIADKEKIYLNLQQVKKCTVNPLTFEKLDSVWRPTQGTFELLYNWLWSHGYIRDGNSDWLIAHDAEVAKAAFKAGWLCRADRRSFKFEEEAENYTAQLGAKAGAA